MVTVGRHGPIVATQRGMNFIRSKRINLFFGPEDSVQAKKTDLNGLKNRKEPPDILLITHLWNTSGVPILTEHLAEYFKGVGLNAAIWSEKSTTQVSTNLIGSGDIDTLEKSFRIFPKIVFLNTTCVSSDLIRRLVFELSRGAINQLILYSHEDIVVLDSQILQLLDSADSTKLHIFAGSLKTANKLQKSFDNKNIIPVPYQISDTNRLKKISKLTTVNDFSSLRILLVGTTLDSRKGHIRAAKTVRWARRFQRLYARTNAQLVPKSIEFYVVGATLYPEPDSITSKIISILGSDLKIFPVLDEDNYIEILSQCNSVICLSQYETLPLYVSESMARGSIILRNNSGGAFEQLKNSVNGIALKNRPIVDGFKIFQLLHRSDAELLDMSLNSRELFAQNHSKDWDRNFSFLQRNG